MAERNEQVDALYKAAIVAGSNDNIPRRVRTKYFPGYYAADLLDPAGYSFEAVYKSCARIHQKTGICPCHTLALDQVVARQVGIGAYYNRSNVGGTWGIAIHWHARLFLGSNCQGGSGWIRHVDFRHCANHYRFKATVLFEGVDNCGLKSLQLV